jgi:hypothetical protein
VKAYFGAISSELSPVQEAVPTLQGDNSCFLLFNTVRLNAERPVAVADGKQQPVIPSNGRPLLLQ